MSTSNDIDIKINSAGEFEVKENFQDAAVMQMSETVEAPTKEGEVAETQKAEAA